MTSPSSKLSLVCLGLALLSTGCREAPGKPRPGPEIGRPDELVSFAPLYRQNCAGCHGSEGQGGAAISLANPVYLAVAGANNIDRIIVDGVPGTMMPPFGRQAGGMLTNLQIHTLATGMLLAWGKPDALRDALAPRYESDAAGDPTQGEKTFGTFCARCHGADALGVASGKTTHTGSIVDPAYLALVSDQSLRSTIVAGVSEWGMPDWRSDLTGAGARAMTDREIADTVAWLASHRTSTPGEPY